jgi:predicted dehydrogenase
MIELLPGSPGTVATRCLNERPKLGFLGLGWIGRKRLEAVARSGKAEICAIADPVTSSVEQVAKVLPAAQRLRQLEDLLELDLDGIVIATPSALHAAQAMQALAQGYAVFCQKPLARTAPETSQVIDTARRANRLLSVDLSYRFTAGMQAIHHLIRRGELGEVYGVEMAFHNAYGPDKPWFYDAALSGGGCLIDLGTHLVDLALWCLDFPVVKQVTSHLCARGAPLVQQGGAVEDYAMVQAHLASGAALQMVCSWKAPAGCEARIEVGFFGTKGGAAFRNVNGSFYDFIAEHHLPDRSRRRLASPPDLWEERGIVDWVRRLATDPAYDPAIERVNEVASVLDAAYQANR